MWKYSLTALFFFLNKTKKPLNISQIYSWLKKFNNMGRFSGWFVFYFTHFYLFFLFLTHMVVLS